MQTLNHINIAAAAAVGVMLFVAGCGLITPSSAADLSLDEDTARQSFVAFLEAWKADRTPADLKSASPSIIASEPEWDAGTKLVSYEVLGEQSNDGANFYTSAELTLHDAQGNAKKQRVEYVIGTEPTITVFRAK